MVLVFDVFLVDVTNEEEITLFIGKFREFDSLSFLSIIGQYEEEIWEVNQQTNSDCNCVDQTFLFNLENLLSRKMRLQFKRPFACHDFLEKNPLNDGSWKKRVNWNLNQQRANLSYFLCLAFQPSNHCQQLNRVF